MCWYTCFAVLRHSLFFRLKARALARNNGERLCMCVYVYSYIHSRTLLMILPAPRRPPPPPHPGSRCGTSRARCRRPRRKRGAGLGARAREWSRPPARSRRPVGRMTKKGRRSQGKGMHASSKEHWRIQKKKRHRSQSSFFLFKKNVILQN